MLKITCKYFGKSPKTFNSILINENCLDFSCPDSAKILNNCRFCEYQKILVCYIFLKYLKKKDKKRKKMNKTKLLSIFCNYDSFGKISIEYSKYTVLKNIYSKGISFSIKHSYAINQIRYVLFNKYFFFSFSNFFKKKMFSHIQIENPIHSNGIILESNKVYEKNVLDEKTSAIFNKSENFFTFDAINIQGEKRLGQISKLKKNFIDRMLLISDFFSKVYKSLS